MDYKILYIWVEGDDDLRFFEMVFQRIFEQMYQHVQMIKYARLTKEKIDAFLESIDSMPNADYIFIADIDKSPDTDVHPLQIFSPREVVSYGDE